MDPGTGRCIRGHLFFQRDQRSGYECSWTGGRGNLRNVPAQVPEAGTYQVTVAVRSDVVDHSLVQTDTAQAVLQVDESGQMKLSYTMVSGTDQEPMYILGVNGYYVNNDRAGALSMD